VLHERALGAPVKVRISEPAQRQAERIDRWWKENRPAAPDAFARELLEASELLAITPEFGAPYVSRQGAVVRRVLLRKSKNHVYYDIDRDAGIVMIVGVWGAPKGRGPNL
jgi:plasmid stabilization system protein ParE